MSRIPWNSLPSSFAKLRSHILLYFSDFLRCRYSSAAPVSSSITARMKLLDAYAYAATGSSLCWSRCAVNAYLCWRAGMFGVGSGSWASVRTCSAITQLIMCTVRAWRRARVVVVDGKELVRGERRRRVSGGDSSSESSSMMAGRSRRLGGALVGDLLPVLHVDCWSSSGFHITTDSLSS